MRLSTLSTRTPGTCTVPSCEHPLREGHTVMEARTWPTPSGSFMKTSGNRMVEATTGGFHGMSASQG